MPGGREEFETQGRERREYFRVEDLLPASIRKIDAESAHMKGKTIPGLPSGVGYPTSHDDTPDESINPVLWQRLTEISQKLDVLLDNMYLTSQGLTNIKVKRVSLSASGIRVVCDESFDRGDCVEIRILLTANASFWVILYGEVIRVTQIDASRCEVAIEFFEMGDEVRDAISAYMISRQREMIHKNEEADG